MTFTWDDKTMGWMLEAAEYTGFYRNMAALLLPHIQKRGTLCDFGCGMALTDMALAPALEAVTCVDQSAPVLAFAQAEARRRGIDNLSCLCANGPEMTGHWDTVMAMFHGRASRICKPYLALAGDRLLLVTHGADTHHGPAFCENATETAAWLDANGWVYTRQDGRLEFGQPHRSLEEAMETSAAYHKGQPIEELRAQVMASVQETGREDYPYYTPKTRSFTLFDIPAAENRGRL